MAKGSKITLSRFLGAVVEGILTDEPHLVSDLGLLEHRL
jgi:hypothetical protein